MIRPPRSRGARIGLACAVITPLLLLNAQLAMVGGSGLRCTVGWMNLLLPAVVSFLGSGGCLLEAQRSYRPVPRVFLLGCGAGLLGLSMLMFIATLFCLPRSWKESSSWRKELASVQDGWHRYVGLRIDPGAAGSVRCQVVRETDLIPWCLVWTSDQCGRRRCMDVALDRAGSVLRCTFTDHELDPAPEMVEIPLRH